MDISDQALNLNRKWNHYVAFCKQYIQYVPKIQYTYKIIIIRATIPTRPVVYICILYNTMMAYETTAVYCSSLHC